MKIDNPALAVGVFGIGMLQVVALYEATAPPLRDIRATNPDDLSMRQALLDANMQVGGVVLLISMWASYATRSALPLVMFVGALAIVAGWRSLILHSPER